MASAPARFEIAPRSGQRSLDSSRGSFAVPLAFSTLSHGLQRCPITLELDAWVHPHLRALDSPSPLHRNCRQPGHTHDEEFFVPRAARGTQYVSKRKLSIRLTLKDHQTSTAKTIKRHESTRPENI
ncbi:hypothetical protein SERLA73DRAFT_73866 [Serpula lacrymans var. lacrymans S7.3]|uniref:Uncharacterized protein n=2 Tax=Serpula lacrymans var. lacrymans TaxID=341189 RepID=F8PX06_SERL3|nr:uncharacterized protein SERLADRAFT_438497 [Serpula lacrymans var. lacrymans S7.9]EGN99332.1 hypothetical protein SERLA73DRAFT_73866 [Serpula lacrymans var. lacrymans S7.3]EGO24895.1 hypothetical protein SERLADRAFT_438497 [Serpula lacrymans var. lacrymans S7.9]